MERASTQPAFTQPGRDRAASIVVLCAVFEARQRLWQGSKPQRDSMKKKEAKSKGFEALHHVLVFRIPVNYLGMSLPH